MASIPASLFAAGFQLKDKKTKAEAEAELNQLLQQGETPTPHPKNLETRFVEGPRGGGLFYANEDTQSSCTVFYLHGGAYLHDFSPFHWRFLQKLIEKTDAKVIAPACRTSWSSCPPGSTLPWKTRPSRHERAATARALKRASYGGHTRARPAHQANHRDSAALRCKRGRTCLRLVSTQTHAW